MAVANNESQSVPQFHVMAAGLPRSGKSTGLNNIFGVKFETKLSAKPVTSKVSTQVFEKNGVKLHITDTPGLKAANADNDENILKSMRRVAENKVLLILTLTVLPNSSITDDYRNIVENLTAILGLKIWNWSLILLTFSDIVRELEECEDELAYQDYLRGHCKELQRVLKRIGVTQPIKLFFEYSSFEHLVDGSLNGIVAIPVGKKTSFSTKKLFPLQAWTHEGYKWTDLAYMEISKLKRIEHNTDIEINRRRNEEADRLRTYLIQFRHDCISVNDIVKATLAGVAGGAVMGRQAGATLGPTAGTVIGALIPAIGAVPGGQLGTQVGPFVGAVAGALSVGGSAAAVYIIRYVVEQRKIDQTEQQIAELQQNHD